MALPLVTYGAAGGLFGALVAATGDLGGLAERGVLGVVLILILVRKATPGWAYDREVTRGDRLEVENNRLRDKLEADIVPLLAKAIIALDEEANRRSRRRT